MQATVKERNTRPSAALPITKVDWERRLSTASSLECRVIDIVGRLYIPTLVLNVLNALPSVFRSVRCDERSDTFPQPRSREDTVFPDYREMRSA